MAAPTLWITEALATTQLWLTDTYEAALLKAPFVADPSTQTFIGDVTADEFVDASYTRATIMNPVATVSDTLGTANYTADPVLFGPVVGGEVAVAMVLYRFVTNDADSPILCSYPIDRTADGTAFTITPTSAGYLAVAVGVCPFT